MWNFGTLLLVATLALASTQSIVLECDFEEYWSGYQCILANITVLDPQASLIITGTHLESRTNEDVRRVQIINSDTPFIIHPLFVEFPNLIELDIYSSNLQSIDLPAEAQLTYLEFSYNNISRLQNGFLRGQSNLATFSAYDCNIEVIEEDAFEGLERLNSLVLIENSISELTARMLAPLESIYYIDLKDNSLTTLPEDLFANKPNLQSLYLERNQIDEIHPRAFAGLQERVQYINLTGNRCANRSFSFYYEGDTEWMLMNNILQQCFNNYIGTPGDVKTFSMQFTGNLTIMDQFGNVIARL